MFFILRNGRLSWGETLWLLFLDQDISLLLLLKLLRVSGRYTYAHKHFNNLLIKHYYIIAPPLIEIL